MDYDNFDIHENISVENITKLIEEFQEVHQKNNEAADAIWVLTSAFIVFTMQSGHGLLESGMCSSKNECNIMIKNAADVIFGSLGYYICGFAFSFGEDKKLSNAFTGFGSFFLLPKVKNEGHLMARYFYQLSFATTATTIVSGSMAERTNLKAYMMFSFLHFFAYVFPAHWIWDEKGYFRENGVVDIAGCGPVHVVGGVSALVATIYLKPRMRAFNGNNSKSMASPTNVVLATFMLWWGWLGFNCGSTFGVSGGKWKLACKASVITINGSVGGGMWSIFYLYWLTKEYKGKLDVGVFTGGIVSGLVSVTAICAICRPWEALIIGFIGGIIFTYGTRLVAALKIDDPVFSVSLHLFCGIWGLIVVGLVGEKETSEDFSRSNGVFKGGSFTFLGFQILAAISVTAWAGIVTFIQLLMVDLAFGLRMSEDDEMLGADPTEHGVNNESYTTKVYGYGSVNRKKSSVKEAVFHTGIYNFGILDLNETIVRKINNNITENKFDVQNEEGKDHKMNNIKEMDEEIEKVDA